jgi:hypothetical protein
MRSKYVGVYRNAIKYDRKRYRVAIKKYQNEEVTYTDVGKFNNEITAAWVYNIHAVHIFGTGAVVNDVDPDMMDAKEYEDFRSKNPKFRAIETEVENFLDTTQIRLRTHKDFND